MSSRLLLVLALLSAPAPPPAAQEPGIACSDPDVSTEDADLSLLTLDQLVDRLPRVGHETWWERETGTVGRSAAVLEMDRRLLSGARLDDEQWRRALSNSGVLRLRERWAAGHEMTFSLSVPSWLRNTRITARILGRAHACSAGYVGAYVGCGLGAPRTIREQWGVGDWPVGRHEVEFDVVVHRGEVEVDASVTRVPGPASRIPEQLLWRGTLRHVIEVVPRVEDVLPSDDSEALRRAVRAALGVDVREDRQDGAPCESVVLSLEPDVASFPQLCGLALDVEYELLRDGEVLESGELVGCRRDQTIPFERAGTSRPDAQTALARVSVADLSDPAIRDSLSVRVRGVADHVLGLWDTDRTWGGALEIPLAELIRNAEGRPSTPWFVRNLGCPP